MKGGHHASFGAMGSYAPLGGLDAHAGYDPSVRLIRLFGVRHAGR
jgi:hypothetical protein